MLIPKNLPEMYATLTAKRSELVVEGLSRPNTWKRCGLPLYSDEAAALIFVRWWETLPEGGGVERQGERYGVYFGEELQGDTLHPDPLTALYEYHMGVSP